jgi:hypothetical protein
VFVALPPLVTAYAFRTGTYRRTGLVGTIARCGLQRPPRRTAQTCLRREVRHATIATAVTWTAGGAIHSVWFRAAP